MARRKTDEPAPEAEADLMAVVEATDPQATASEPASPVPPETLHVKESAPAQATVQAKSGGGGAGAFFGMVLGGVIAAAGGFGLARLMPDLLPMGNESTLSETVAAQAQELAALREQLAALPAKPAPDPGIEARLAALEGATSTDLESRLSSLESQIAALPSPSASGPTTDPALLADIAALKQQVSSLGSGGTVPADVIAAATAAEARLQEAEARAAELAEQAVTAAAAARRAAALDRIAAAFDSGAPYTSAATELGPDLAPALSEYAAAGIPTIADLQDSFEDAARQSLEDALRANMGESWTDRVSNFLRSQTGLRSLTPREGDDPDAILSRAEAALAAGRIADALAELDAMPDAGKPALADWIADAGKRTAAEDALSQLLAE